MHAQSSCALTLRTPIESIDATDEMHRADAGEGREHPVEVRSEEAGATSDEADAKRLGRVDAFIDLSIVKNERI